jgi:hypothetical protein
MFLANGTEVTADREAWSKLPAEDRALFSEIDPGAQVDGTVIFDIPDGQTPARVVMHESGTSPGASIQVRSG